MISHQHFNVTHNHKQQTIQTGSETRVLGDGGRQSKKQSNTAQHLVLVAHTKKSTLSLPFATIGFHRLPFQQNSSNSSSNYPLQVVAGTVIAELFNCFTASTPTAAAAVAAAAAAAAVVFIFNRSMLQYRGRWLQVTSE